MNKIFYITTVENGKKWNLLTPDLSKYDYLEFTEYRSATQKERFDYYIKQSFIDGAPYLPKLYLNAHNSGNFGFWLKDRIYDRYLSSSLDIKSKLSKEIFSRYDEGMGNEFKNGKFFSVASSSRFATASFSEKKDGVVSLIKEISINGQKKKCKVSLEEGLHIYSTAGGEISSPQMDVVVETDEDVFFIEVKCHEIFDVHKEVKLKWKYMDAPILQDLLHLPQNPHKHTMITTMEDGKEVDYIGVDGRYLTPKVFGCDLETYHFDFKQFLCHLMGICDYCSTTKKRVHFYYLFYKNEKFIKEESDGIYSELEKELNTIFSHFKKLYPNIDFGAMYNNQFDTLDSITRQIG